MDKTIIQTILLLSLILGAILGLLAPIPFIGIVMLLTALLLASPLVTVYLIMDGKLDLTTIKDSIITGAAIGFVSNIAFSSVYSIVMAILAKGFNITTNFFLSAMITNSPIWLLAIFIIFIGILSAVTNAFSGFLTYYIINFIRDIYEQRLKNNNKKEI